MLPRGLPLLVASFDSSIVSLAAMKTRRNLIFLWALECFTEDSNRFIALGNMNCENEFEGPQSAGGGQREAGKRLTATFPQ